MKVKRTVCCPLTVRRHSQAIDRGFAVTVFGMAEESRRAFEIPDLKITVTGCTQNSAFAREHRHAGNGVTNRP